MENSMPLIKEFVISNPPTYWDLVFKKPKFDKEGKLITHTRFYLTANLFYADKVKKEVWNYLFKGKKSQQSLNLDEPAEEDGSKPKGGLNVA